MFGASDLHTNSMFNIFSRNMTIYDIDVFGLMNVSDETLEVILLVVMFSPPKKTTRPSTDQQRLRWAGKYNQIYTFPLSVHKDEHISECSSR